jgi:hypothetical protein
MRMGKPKAMGGWGLKNIHHFGRAIETTSLCVGTYIYISKI